MMKMRMTKTDSNLVKLIQYQKPGAEMHQVFYWRMLLRYNQVNMSEKKTVKVVAAIIRDGNRILATQRGYGEQKDGWEFPGGKVESNETPEAAIVREIREELNADIEVTGFLTTVEHDYPNFHLSMDCFWARLAEGSEMKLLEHEAAKWLSIEDINSVDWLPADIKVVEAIIRVGLEVQGRVVFEKKNSKTKNK